ncbi:TPA: hypothetical protein ACKRM8_006101 [Pseudomonas aeruginosa]
MIKKVASLVVVSSGLAGCMAMTPQEIRATAPEVYETSTSVDAALRCFSASADYLRVTTYPESGSVDLTVETYQMLETRVLYMATLDRLPDGSRVSARYSGKNSMSISESGFRKLLNTCAPSRAR